MVQKNGQIKKQFYTYCGFNEYSIQLFSIIRGSVTATYAMFYWKISSKLFSDNFNLLYHSLDT